jgi:hypothetical protein
MSDPFDTPDLGDRSRPNVSITIGGYLNTYSGAMRMSGYLVKQDGGVTWWYDAPVTFEGGPFDTCAEALQYVLDYLTSHVLDAPTRTGGWKVLAE